MTIRTVAIAVTFLAVTLSLEAAAETINGCVKNKTGALRIVADPADCSSRETPISCLGQ